MSWKTRFCEGIHGCCLFSPACVKELSRGTACAASNSCPSNEQMHELAGGHRYARKAHPLPESADMKLASLRSGSRDGSLIVVNRDLSKAVVVAHIAPTLQSALEDWAVKAPLLEAVSAQLESNAVADTFPLDVTLLASPLPRSFQFLDGSVYLNHMKKARALRKEAMPAHFDTEALMYQGMSDGFCGPTEPFLLPSDTLEVDYEAEIAVIVDDVPMGTPVAEAARHIKLLMLLNDYTLRSLTRTELPKGFGFLQAKPTSSFSPVAITPQELGDGWDGAKVHLRVESRINGKLMGSPNAGLGMYFTYSQLIAHAARTRKLGAGTIIGAGAISNDDPAAGFGCIAEARVHEQEVHSEPSTPFLRFGDIMRIEAIDQHGHSPFGAIENEIRRPLE